MPQPLSTTITYLNANGSGANDGHCSSYDTEWLRRTGHPETSREVNGYPQVHLWGQEIRDDPPIMAYKDIMDSDAGVKDWTGLIRRFGFSYVDGCPPTPSATQALLERIAFIRATHYGSFWDFTSDLSSKDTAYTTLALPAHTDTTYFTDPCGLQMFHLLSHTAGAGGASLLVDGFKAAATLRLEAPAAYDVLSTVRVPAHASGNEGVSIRPVRAFPVLNHDPETERLVQVRWNNDDRGTLCGDQRRVEEWYLAARKWADVLRRGGSEYWEQLRPGRALSKRIYHIILQRS
ncbi:trimethyllysine dioxygenase [Lasallia pustulata]|uniref:Trimethyllysine dioxygenase n=1 Tax=Lasallia pustulata TaxID=136370 RepID=A0A1W5D5C5_9LECA|nr:trimethyllysine dioxygenase [Lasallia pustulata]